MKIKGIVTALLLAFVVASLALFGIKEVLHARAVKAARGQPALSTPLDAPLPAVAPPVVETPPPATPAPVPGTPKEILAPAPAKVAQAHPEKIVPKAPPAQSLDSKVIVYYLHTTARCTKCLKIEAYTAAEVTGPLAGPLSEGRLEWKVLNVDEPENAHFTEDYQLYTKSVVVSEIRGGKEVQWKRLDKVWDYLDDQQVFMKYVGEEVRDYLKPPSSAAETSK